MNGEPPKRRLHKLRGGDGPGRPDTPPPKWPDLGDLEPYWESFTAFARSEMGTAITTELRQFSDGSWEFHASTSLDRRENQRVERTGQSYTQSLVYDSEDDEMTFTDHRDDSSWVMEDVFGDPYTATSHL